jgi:hypothetical protein
VIKPTVENPKEIVKDLFTIVLEFDGGTYLFQAEAAKPNQALQIWAARSAQLGIEQIKKADAKDLIEQVSGTPELTPVDGCKNVWCWSGLIREKLGLVHLVKTQYS